MTSGQTNSLPPWGTPAKRPWYRRPLVWVGIAVAAPFLAIASVVAYVVITAPPDDHYWVEQESVTEAISEPCEEMRIAGEAIPQISTTPEGVAAMLHFAQVARAIPAAIDGVPEADDDAIKWRDGWLRIIEATETYADAGGKSAWISQRDENGVRIIEHMQSATDVECNVPSTIELLEYPEFASENL